MLIPVKTTTYSLSSAIEHQYHKTEIERKMMREKIYMHN